MGIKTTAIVGGICKDLGFVYYELYHRSLNSDKFIHFIENLHKKMKKKNYVIYLDNLSVHKTKKA